jgi:xylulokinase
VPSRKTDVPHQVASVPGIGDGQYVLVNNQDNAGRCFEWFRDTLAGYGAAVSYEELLALAATAAPGSGGVLFTPWLTGERSTLDDRNARGGFHNVELRTGPAELARAVLEGVAFNSRLLLEVTERFAGRRFESLRIIGGGARSGLWCQIVADVTDRTIERVESPMVVGLRGAALILALALGAVSHDEIRSLVPVDRVFSPNPATRDVYDRLHAEFPRLHSRNKGMFARLNG